jgi:amidase
MVKSKLAPISEPVPPESPAKSAGFELEESTIAAQQVAMQSGALTARAIAETYLERIAEFDKRGPCINAIIEVNPDALARADELDRERRSGQINGPLHGIAVVVKDNIDTADRMNTSAGSYLLQGCVVKEDATVVKKLRQAGALILGKANLNEMALGDRPSARGGPVRNPYALDRKITGSSGGPAAAVAANFAAFAIGTDTNASMRFPAADCALVALKPTLGLISRAGAFPGMITIDTLGPLTRSVSDLAIALGVLVGTDARDPATLQAGERGHSDYQQFLQAGGLKGARIGVARKDFFGINPEIDEAMEAAIEVLKQQGAEIVEGVSIEAIPYGGYRSEARRLIQAMDFKAIVDYFNHLGPASPIRSFEQFRYLLLTGSLPTSLRVDSRLKSNDQARLVSLFAEKPELVRLYDLAREQFLRAQQQIILSVMDGERLDAITFPTRTSFAAPLLPDDSLRLESAGQPEIASYSGFPELTVPAGYSRAGLPIGISFLGRAFAEPLLLRLAYSYEQATRQRHAPDMRRGLPPVPERIPDVPINDRFMLRTIIAGKSGRVEGNNFSAGVERGEPRHGTARLIDRTVWYTWTAPEAGLALFDVAESYPAHHVVAVYKGTSLSQLAEVACNNYDAGDDTPETGLGFVAEKNTAYQIAIGSNLEMASLGKVVLKWEMPSSGLSR